MACAASHSVAFNFSLTSDPFPEHSSPRPSTGAAGVSVSCQPFNADHALLSGRGGSGVGWGVWGGSWWTRSLRTIWKKKKSFFSFDGVGDTMIVSTGFNGNTWHHVFFFVRTINKWTTYVAQSLASSWNFLNSAAFLYFHFVVILKIRLKHTFGLTVPNASLEMTAAISLPSSFVVKW